MDRNVTKLGLTALSMLPTGVWRRPFSLTAGDSRSPAMLLRFSTIVAICLIAASQARATCGDWLAHPDDSKASAADGNRAGAGEGAIESTAPAPQPCPCRGPSCGEQPDAPAAPVPPHVQTVADQLANLARSTSDDVAEGESALRWRENASPTAGYLRRIEHPPRV